jgi:hypothetical protein
VLWHDAGDLQKLGDGPEGHTKGHQNNRQGT